MGTKHPNVNLQENYKKSKCLVDNVNNLTIDLERYICENKCFFDPILFEDCPNSHTGDISIFNDKTFQSSFPGFREEIEKYPQFQANTTFNNELLEEVLIIEHDKSAVVEMYLLLKIITTMIDIRKREASS